MKIYGNLDAAHKKLLKATLETQPPPPKTTYRYWRLVANGDYHHIPIPLGDPLIRQYEEKLRQGVIHGRDDGPGTVSDAIGTIDPMLEAGPAEPKSMIVVAGRKYHLESDGAPRVDSRSGVRISSERSGSEPDETTDSGSKDEDDETDGPGGKPPPETDMTGGEQKTSFITTAVKMFKGNAKSKDKE